MAEVYTSCQWCGAPFETEPHFSGTDKCLKCGFAMLSGDIPLDHPRASEMRAKYQHFRDAVERKHGDLPPGGLTLNVIVEQRH
jgi:hypothetical protein